MSGGGVYGLRRLAEPRLQRLILVTIAFVLVCFRLLQFVLFTTQIQWGYDFSAYYAAAERLLDGLSPYQPHQLAGPYSPQQQFLYLYPPPLAAAALVFHQPWSLWQLLAPGDYRAAAWVWTAIGLVVLVLTVMAVARAEGLDDRLRQGVGLGPWILVAAAIGFPPVIGELVLGNVHLVLLGLLGLAWLGVRGGTVKGERIAGAAVGIAAVIKVFPGLLLLWFLLTRRYQAALFTVLGAAAVSVATIPITGLQPWLDYPTVLANLGQPIDTRDTLAPTVWLAELIGFTPARLIVTGAGLAILVATARRLPLASSFAMAVLVSILIAPALYHHYLAILVLPFLLLLADGKPIAGLALAYLLMSGGEQQALGGLDWVLNKGLPTLGVLLLLGLALLPAGQRDHDDRVIREATAPG